MSDGKYGVTSCEDDYENFVKWYETIEEAIEAYTNFNGERSGHVNIVVKVDSVLESLVDEMSKRNDNFYEDGYKKGMSYHEYMVAHVDGVVRKWMGGGGHDN